MLDFSRCVMYQSVLVNGIMYGVCVEYMSYFSDEEARVFRISKNVFVCLI